MSKPSHDVIRRRVGIFTRPERRLSFNLPGKHFGESFLNDGSHKIAVFLHDHARFIVSLHENGVKIRKYEITFRKLYDGVTELIVEITRTRSRMVGARAIVRFSGNLTVAIILEPPASTRSVDVLAIRICMQIIEGFQGDEIVGARTIDFTESLAGRLESIDPAVGPYSNVAARSILTHTSFASNDPASRTMNSCFRPLVSLYRVSETRRVESSAKIGLLQNWLILRRRTPGMESLLGELDIVMFVV